MLPTSTSSERTDGTVCELLLKAVGSDDQSLSVCVLCMLTLKVFSSKNNSAMPEDEIFFIADTAGATLNAVFRSAETALFSADDSDVTVTALPAHDEKHVSRVRVHRVNAKNLLIVDSFLFFISVYSVRINRAENLSFNWRCCPKANNLKHYNIIRLFLQLRNGVWR